MQGKLLAGALVAATLAVSTPSGAVGVTGPNDLQPAEFWAYVEGSDGGFARVEARDDEPVAIEILDPVVGGVQLEGHLLLGAEAPATGPATRVNALLRSPASGAADSDLDLRSFVTFDLAVLSATRLSAPVRIVGRGIGGSAGIDRDPVTGVGSRWLSSGFVTIFSTDATGGIASVVQSWEIPSNFSTTPIDDVVVLQTNELYRIIIRSLADVDLLTPPTLDGFAYLFIDPQVSLATKAADLDLVVSANVPTAIPEPAAGPLAAAGALAWRARARTQRRRIASISSGRDSSM